MPNQVIKYLLKLNDVRRIQDAITAIESTMTTTWIYTSTDQELKYFNLLRTKLKTY